MFGADEIQQTSTAEIRLTLAVIVKRHKERFNHYKWETETLNRFRF